MKLYHGTSERVAKKAMEEGLLPRGKRPGNWKHTVNSRRDSVYFTDVYAPYFAIQATKDFEKERLAIIEIDTDTLVQDLFIPDEDFLEQATKLMGQDHGAPLTWTMKKRTQYFRKIAAYNGNLWTKSVESLGTCSYRGPVMPRHFQRVSFIETKNPLILDAMDPMISIHNHRFCSGRYAALTRYFMGEKVAPEEMDGIAGYQPSPEEDPNGKFATMAEQWRQYLQEKLSDQSGIEVISLQPNVADLLTAKSVEQTV